MRDGDPILNRVPSIFYDAQQVLIERGKDYGGHLVDDYMPFGLASYVQMVHLKACRLVSGVKRGLLPHQLADSAIDLVNYAAFLAAYIDERVQSELRDEIERIDEETPF